jgi:glycosyltransferase involved in cell wall biosynthesis
MIMKSSQSQQRNVLHLIGSFDQGGSERQALQLVRLMRGRERVHLACLARRGALLPEAEALGCGDISEFPLTSFYDRNMLTQLRRFARHLREQEITVVQTHDFYTNVFGMIGASLARVPARIAARRETAGFRTPAQLAVERGAYRLAHAVVANAEAVKAQLIREGVRAQKIVTVYNGIDMERVREGGDVPRAEALAALGLPQDVPRRLVSIVANLRHPVKDHATFLRAARRVHAAVPDAAFVLAGEGSLTEPMRALASELGIARETFFIGSCEQVASLLSLSDVCVLSSRAEGFSNALLEYMAAARPVVATEVGGAREAVAEGETGYLVQPGGDEAMAARIVALLRDPERARAMGERGRQIVEAKFSTGAQLERTLSLYDQLLKPAPTPLARAADGVRSEGAS